MVRGTTPTLYYVLPFPTDLLETVASLYITFTQEGKTVLEKSLEDITITDNVISCPLSQYDTLHLHEDKYVNMQIRIKFADGEAFASDEITASVKRILKDGEI